MTNDTPTNKTLLRIDFSQLLATYPNQWVALTADESKVVASGITPVEVLERAQQAGVTNPILTHVSKNHTPHVI